MKPALEAYSLSFAFGLVIFAAVLILLLARASRGHSSVDDRNAFMDTAPRAFFYVPGMIVAPALFAWLAGVSHEVSKVLSTATAVDFTKFMLNMSDRFGEAGILEMLGRAFLAIVLCIVYMFALLLWLLEDLVAQYSLWLLTVLFPLGAAMSLWPGNRRMLWRAVGVVVGCMLVPTVTRFGYWVMTLFNTTTIEGNFGILEMLQAIVVIMLATSMPLLFSMVMPMLMPQGAAASNGVAGNYSAHLQSAGNAARNGFQRLGNSFKGKGQGSNAMSESGSASTETGTAAAEGAEGSAAAGSTAAGSSSAVSASGGNPYVAAALMVADAAVSTVKAVRGAAVESALRANAASGGGYATDPGNGPSAPRQGSPARRGTGGSPSGSEPAAGETAGVETAGVETAGGTYASVDDGTGGMESEPFASAGLADQVSEPSSPPNTSEEFDPRPPEPESGAEPNPAPAAGRAHASASQPVPGPPPVPRGVSSVPRRAVPRQGRPETPKGK